ncbi:2-enoate reductase [Anaerobacterium chartisolvens]|uniref:2-enoate reductase n=1 Tax=Anaerobacterium chartisolvens TaxID=1297424 RepID=A0A369AN66_9FIRM|nr:FAD-dependent oxidoreductase [Anaerobacterium chartisolvens]RCX10515.1 2-enoate reductase [Anaerobacterium chartisolvens]
MHDKLFERGNIGKCRIKNRIIMAPMGNINMADPIGRPLPKMIDYFAERAKGGAGLIITGLIPVSYGIDPTVSEDNDTTYFPRIDGSSRTRLSGWRDIASAVHSYDAKLFVQLTAGMGRVGSPECALKGKIPKSASLNRNFYVPQIPHMPFTDGQIKKIVRSFGQSAVNAKVSGADGVQLHGHEGYLMDQLTSSPWNRRILGRYSDKLQFAVDVVKEIKKRCGESFPIIYRLDLTQALEESYGAEVFKKRFRGMERTAEEGLFMCRVLAEAGVDAFDVDKGCYDNWFYPHPPAYFKDAPYAEETAGRLKEYFNEQQIGVPVIAVGKLGDPAVAERILNEGRADFVMLGRPLLADPYWPEKVKSGRIREITHCIGDQEGCIQSFILGGHPCCSVNPYTGFEDSKKITEAKAIKSIAVIGAGPGGCEAAKTLVKRGHKVTLYEKGDRIGGQLIAGSRPGIKQDVRRYLDNLQYQMLQLEENGLRIVLNKEADVQDIKGKYDAVILSSGLKPFVPKIEGMEKMRFSDARSFLNGTMELPSDVKRLVIIGGGVVGCELAYTLAADGEIDVSIVEMLPELMEGVVHSNRSMLLWMLMGRGSATGRGCDSIGKPVKAYTASRAVRLDEGKVYIEANRGRWDPYTPWRTLVPENIHNPFDKKLKAGDVELISLDADYVIFSTGGVSDNSLYHLMCRENAASEIYLIGDARQPGRVWEAVTAANDVARSI